MTGAQYPDPFFTSHTIGSFCGSFPTSFVSGDVALCAGPRNRTQSLVRASLCSGFGGA
jgi:hypothetical protein